MREIPFFAALLIFICTFFSCEKIVDLNLEVADPAIVIEGIIDNSDKPAFVKLTKTAGNDALNTFPAVSGATVTLSDNVGNTETLAETEPGIYTSGNLVGTPGKTYKLTVSVEGEIFEATSTMPQPVPIDSLKIVETTRWGETIKGAQVLFQDPAGIDNYYRFSLVRNDAPFSSIFIMKDNLYNGEYIEYDIAQASEDPLEVGDRVLVSMYSIDPDVYNYFLTIPSHWEPPANPANPISNVNNGALGYFSAQTVSQKNIVVQ